MNFIFGRNTNVIEFLTTQSREILKKFFKHFFTNLNKIFVQKIKNFGEILKESQANSEELQNNFQKIPKCTRQTNSSNKVSWEKFRKIVEKF